MHDHALFFRRGKQKSKVFYAPIWSFSAKNIRRRVTLSVKVDIYITYSKRSIYLCLCFPDLSTLCIGYQML